MAGGSPYLRTTYPEEMAILNTPSRRVGCLLERVHLVKGGDFLLVGEDDVGALPDKLLEIVAVPVNAERV